MASLSGPFSVAPVFQPWCSLASKATPLVVLESDIITQLIHLGGSSSLQAEFDAFVTMSPVTHFVALAKPFAILTLSVKESWQSTFSDSSRLLLFAADARRWGIPPCLSISLSINPPVENSFSVTQHPYGSLLISPWYLQKTSARAGLMRRPTG